MAYIRDRREERTGFQSGSPLKPSYDCGCDFVMVYRLNDSTADRIRAHKEKGYVVHFMTGISWGSYEDYLDGKFDGTDHWQEGQRDRFGNTILHSKRTPYLMPAVAFADYLTEQLKRVVDAGADAIHLEEPEFFDRSGYSEAFKREYLLYYRAPWKPAHESYNERYKCARLKAYLNVRTITRVASAIKEYAFLSYNKVIRVYIPTHSLLNYTQWKIVSPEGKLADIEPLDGCIAQVWTGTSREQNWYNGMRRERTFETAFLEYGVMQELVSGTGKKMWFLHDPIEDNPIFDWTDYRKNYLKTVAASLLHPKINSYEICPWPNRVFEDSYPKGSPGAQPIPEDYAVVLNNMFQTLGDMDCVQTADVLRVGILCADSQLYQRTNPDFPGENADERTGTVLGDLQQDIDEYKEKLFTGQDADGMLLKKFACSVAFPGFYSLALPLLKHGLPVRPVLLDNARRYNGYLNEYDVLVLSYEFMKPEYPDVNTVLAQWVARGGTLLYVGDGSDPFHGIDAWWSGTYSTPAMHLFEMLGIPNISDECSIHKVDKGVAAIWNVHPAIICYNATNAEAYRSFFCEAIAQKQLVWKTSNYLELQRGPYLVSAVLEESCSSMPRTYTGLYADMCSPSFAIVSTKTLLPGENTILFDFSTIQQERLRIIGTSVRILELQEENGDIVLKVRGASLSTAYIRLRVPAAVTGAACDSGVTIAVENDAASKTALLSLTSNAEDTIIRLWMT